MRPFALRLLLALAVLACGAFAGSAARGAGSAQTAAELNFFYVTATQVQLKVGTTVVASGGQVPAGSYNVNVYDPPGAATSPKFVFNGPGVSLSTDLNSTGMGVDNTSTFGPYTLAAGASYTIGDSAIGTISFTTTAGGSTSGGTTTTSGGTTTTSGGTTTTSGGTSSLTAASAAVSATGKAMFMVGGATPKTLKAGTYKVTVLDRSTKAGLALGNGTRTVTVSGAAWTGTTSKSVALTAGKWYFQASPGGAKTWFTVR